VVVAAAVAAIPRLCGQWVSKQRSARSADASVEALPSLQVSRTFTFGERIASGPLQLEKTVYFRNPLSEPVRLLLPPPSCCMSATAVPVEVPPGASSRMTIKLRVPPAGRVRRYITIRTKPYGPTLTVQFRGAVYPPLKLVGPERVLIHRGEKAVVSLGMEQYRRGEEPGPLSGRFSVEGARLVSCQVGPWQLWGDSLFRRYSELELEIDGPRKNERDAVYRTVVVTSCEVQATWRILVEAQGWVRCAPRTILLTQERSSQEIAVTSDDGAMFSVRPVSVPHGLSVTVATQGRRKRHLLRIALRGLPARSRVATVVLATDHPKETEVTMRVLTLPGRCPSADRDAQAQTAEAKGT